MAASRDGNDGKDSAGFLRRMVRLVSSPGADAARGADSPSGLERSELRAMVERKRRNDFVRKREFDMLRRLRREGFAGTPVTGSTLPDDTDAPSAWTTGVQGAESGVKAKIDAIEQQMVGDATASLIAAAAAAPATRAPATPTLALPQEAEVAELAQDPLLDEAVIAFANGEMAHCEQALAALTASGGARAHHADTWLVRLDFYRATGAQVPFEALAAQFARRFARPAPTWFSLPQRVAQEAARRPAATAAAAARPGLGWNCPAVLDDAALQRLQAFVQHTPAPWVVDWSGLQHVQVDAAAPGARLLQEWASQPMPLHWVGSETLLQRLREATPAGVRDTAPALWLLRLQALRLLHRAQAFDEAALDYCITYEVSPPPWEPPRGRVRLGLDGLPLQLSALQVPTPGRTGAPPPPGAPARAELELAGQLVGDIDATLRRLEQQLGSATQVHVDCARLVRVDFNAAGDLLNWVLARRQEQRSLRFFDAHRLVALLFGAMGISEHAQVRVHSV